MTTPFSENSGVSHGIILGYYCADLSTTKLTIVMYILTS